jgi:zinc protease
MRVLGIEHRELPLVEFTLRLQGGHGSDPPAKAGVASLLGELMLQGTRNRTPEELEDALGELGANLDIAAGREGLAIEANGLARNFPALLDLFVEILLQPRWDEQEFERLKSAQLTGIRQREGDPQNVADEAFHRVLYGNDHIFAIPTRGTAETVAGITLKDLQAFYEKNFSPSVAAFHIAGSVSRDEVLTALQDLNARWKPKQVEFPSYALPESPSKPVVYFIDVPGSTQSILYVGSLALNGTDDDYNNLVYANNRLGAGSSARLTQLLRIEKGYTYGARSSITRRRETAPFLARTSVRANVTLESLELLRQQLQGYHDTFTQEDLDTTKNLVLKRATRAFETLGDLVAVLEDISTFDLPLNFIERDQRELQGLTLEDVRRTIATYIDETRMVYVIVGDGQTQLDRIKELGYGDPIVLDVHGRPLG